MSDDVKVLPDTNGAREADPEVPNFGTNYVERGLHLIGDFEAGLLSVSAGACLHSYDGDLYYATEINRRTGESRLSIPAGTSGVWYDFDARSLVVGSDPGEPSLQIGSVDASAETVDETINRTRDATFGDASSDSLSTGEADIGQLISSLDAKGYDLSNVGSLDINGGFITADGDLETAINEASAGDLILLLNKTYQIDNIDTEVTLLGTHVTMFSGSSGTRLSTDSSSEISVSSKVKIVNTRIESDMSLGQTVIQGCSILDASLSIGGDGSRIYGCVGGDVVFESGSSSCIIDASSLTSVTDNGNNTVGDIA